ncbi:MAG TPA: hydrogenase maturation nickel metallochaperone HypA [bacterium (Candidatus Stahlbacteria)]|nr:hydrogenase maturation nickel metallochaperone HypA [Candidatus Stahlbacteria bacterium]
MHEFSIAQNIVRIVKDQVDNGELSRITKVKVKVGELSGVVPEALEFSFRVIAENNKMRGAHLEIDFIPLKVKCKNCEKEFRLDFPSFVCPDCFSSDLDILAGDELFLESIEIADTDEQSNVASRQVSISDP